MLCGLAFAAYSFMGGMLEWIFRKNAHKHSGRIWAMAIFTAVWLLGTLWVVFAAREQNIREKLAAAALWLLDAATTVWEAVCRWKKFVISVLVIGALYGIVRLLVKLGTERA